VRSIDLRSHLEQYDTLFVDVDGVLCRSDDFFEQAVVALNAFDRKNLYICTNSVRRTPSILAERLRRAGLDVDPGRIYTGARIAISYLHGSGITDDVYLLGCGAARAYFEENGIEVTGSIDGSKAVVLGAIAEEDMNLAVYTSVMNRHLNGLLTVATSEDLVVPDAGGRAKLATGFLALFLKKLSAANYALVGKPSPLYFEQVMAAARGEGGERILMIGDTYHADILGALDAGIDALHVCDADPPGESRRGSRTARLELSSEVTVHG